MKNAKKYIIKYLFIAAMILAILYTFKDLIKPVFTQLKATSFVTVILICLCCICYEAVEGWVTCSFARKYKKDFPYRYGVGSAFYACFYRVATLGSGSGVSVVYYLHEKGIDYSTATGLYMMEYLLHKISIALLSFLFLLINFPFFQNQFSDYMPLLISGYVLTAVISLVFALFSVSKRLHHLVLWIFEKVNHWRKGKFDKQYVEAKESLRILEIAAKDLLVDKKLVITTILKDCIKLLFWYSIPFFVMYETKAISFEQSIAITSLSILLAAVIPSPAGIGAIEFVLIVLFRKIVGNDSAVCISILYRFATFVFPFLVGAIYIIIRRVWFYKNRQPKHGEKETMNS